MKEFYIQFFSVNTKDYVNIGGDIEINKLLMFIMPLFIIGCIIVHLLRKNIFYMVKQLSRHGATDADKACTLAAIGLDKSKLLRYMLSHDGQLTRVVKRKGAAEYTYEEYRRLEREKKLPKEKIDFDSAEFYLTSGEDLRIKRILERYDIPISKTVLACVFIFVLFVCVMLLMPELLSLIDSAVCFVKGIYS